MGTIESDFLEHEFIWNTLMGSTASRFLDTKSGGLCSYWLEWYEGNLRSLSSRVFTEKKKLIFCFTLHTHFLQEQKAAAARHDRFTSKTSKMHCWIFFFLPTEGSNYKFLQNSVSKITFYVLICNRDRSLGSAWHDLRYERSRTLRHSNSMKKKWPQFGGTTTEKCRKSQTLSNLG